MTKMTWHESDYDSIPVAMTGHPLLSRQRAGLATTARQHIGCGAHHLRTDTDLWVDTDLKGAK
jgi:hypothetical protein